MADRVAAVHNRTRALLAAVAVHRLEALAPLLQNGQDTPAIQDILDRLRRVEGVTDVSLFDASGGLVAHDRLLVTGKRSCARPGGSGQGLSPVGVSG